MTKLSELITIEKTSQIAKITVSRGDVYRMRMDQRNGIVPKLGDSYRNKFFVVLGFDGDSVYGGVIINSEINPNIKAFIQHWQVLIHQSDYPFLKHDSYVDCMRLKTAELSKFAEWDYLGKLKEATINQIVELVIDSPQEIKARLKMFGLIE